jgi:nucleotide-binding universal stress UspA family protein
MTNYHQKEEQMKILVGYDGSNSAKEALRLAKTHARAFAASVQVVTSMFKGTEDEQKEIRKAENGLEYTRSVFDSDGIDCQTHLLIRGLGPGEDLVRFADENSIDEIIIGVKRRSKVGKLMFGSTAQYVILNAPCPVVTVK